MKANFYVNFYYSLMKSRIFQYNKNNIIKFFQFLKLDGILNSFVKKMYDEINYRHVFSQIDTFMKNDNIPIFSRIEIETINRCNLTCSFCPANKNNDPRDFSLMDEKLFFNILYQLRNLNYQGELFL